MTTDPNEPPEATATHDTAKPYGTPTTPRITIRGETVLDAQPELAGITITITARGTDRRTTLDDLTHRNAQALDLIKTYGDALDTLETGTLLITPQLREKGRGERVRSYTGLVRIGATLTDFTALGELTTRLAEIDLTRVDGPSWSLRPDSPAYRTARRQAVRSAVQRAREYADALGSRLVALTELTDEGIAGPTPYRERSKMRTTAYSAAGAEEPPEPLDLEPERQIIHASVTAHFTITPPDLS
ncbi:MAG: uncharacterized protein QOI83_5030 [Streptomycetaceae bacterium]|nr:uncharacterized protein [Streptomycetaceae bacterium]